MRAIALSFLFAATAFSLAWTRQRRRRTQIDRFRVVQLRPIVYRIETRVFPTYIDTKRYWNNQIERQTIPLRRPRRSPFVPTYIVDLQAYASDSRVPSQMEMFLRLIQLHFSACPLIVLELRHEAREWSAQALISHQLHPL